MTTWEITQYGVLKEAGPSGRYLFTLSEQPGLGADAAKILAMIKATPDAVAALVIAESFMAGFEGDEMQDGIADKLATIRAALALATNGTPLPADPLRDTAPELLELAKLFAETIRYEQRKSTKAGDDEGVRLKGFTLARVEAAIKQAGGQS